MKKTLAAFLLAMSLSAFAGPKSDSLRSSAGYLFMVESNLQGESYLKLDRMMDRLESILANYTSVALANHAIERLAICAETLETVEYNLSAQDSFRIDKIIEMVQRIVDENPYTPPAPPIDGPGQDYEDDVIVVDPVDPIENNPVSQCLFQMNDLEVFQLIDSNENKESDSHWNIQVIKDAAYTYNACKSDLANLFVEVQSRSGGKLKTEDSQANFKKILSHVNGIVALQGTLAYEASISYYAMYDLENRWQDAEANFVLVASAFQVSPMPFSNVSSVMEEIIKQKGNTKTPEIQAEFEMVFGL